MRLTVLAISIGALLLSAGCGGGSDGNGDRYESVADIVTALDKHTLSNTTIPTQELQRRPGLGGLTVSSITKHEYYLAEEGKKFDVDPGGYSVEVYIYRDQKMAAEESAEMNTPDNQFHIEGNIVLLLDYPSKDDLDRLLANLRD